ncbi:MAG TPA: hypothetical protein VMX94_06085 [Armatimonadota bacterium]|nr:hypothetical protein [Armatimonadota bacterium]
MSSRADKIAAILAERGEDVEITDGAGVGVHRVIVGIADTGTVAGYIGTDFSEARPALALYAAPDTTIDVGSRFVYEGQVHSADMRFIGRWAGSVDYALFICGPVWGEM